MAAREDLEAALDAAPHDAAAFLVYADWLLEQGDPHGELIRIEEALARAPDDLTLKAADEQLRPLLPEQLVSRWQLGYPRHVELSWVIDDEVPALDRLLRSRLCRFLEGVTLTDYVTLSNVLGPLAALPRLHAVTLTGALELINPSALVQLLRGIVALPRVTHLTLRTRQVTAALAELTAFTKLEQLTLWGAWLGPEDAPALRLVREKVTPGCVLRLEHSSVTFETEARLRDVWPFELEDAAAPGLLVVEPRAERGRYLLEGHDLRIGSHLACDLPISGQGLDAVHFIFDGNRVREAGELHARKRRLADGDRVPAGDVVLRYCNDVAAARRALAGD